MSSIRTYPEIIHISRQRYNALNTRISSQSISNIHTEPKIQRVKDSNQEIECAKYSYWANVSNNHIGVYISQLIRYARACSTYDQFLSRNRLLTDKLMLQGFLKSRLMSAFRKFYGRYNDLIYNYKLSLSHMSYQ
jgi:hypothetical protein